MAKQFKRKPVMSTPVNTTVDTTPTPKPDDRTPGQKLAADWPKKHNELAPFITAKGTVRGGLTQSQQAQARKILAGYGF